MAMKGMQNTIIRSGGWILVLLGMMFGISACDQYFMISPANWGIALGIVFVTLVFTFILVSIDMPKVGKFDIPKIKRILFIVFLAVDVLFVVLGFVFDGGFALQAYLMLLGMVLMAIVFKLEIDAIEKRKTVIGVLFLAIEVVLAILVILAIPAGAWMFILFLVSGIAGVVGWNNLQSIFWNQKKQSIIFLAIAIAAAWVCTIIMLLVPLSWVNLLWPILMTLGYLMVLGIEQKMRAKKLLVYIK
ncbi:MAG TPA: hypothetical protein VKK79_18665 [Candidatus Lokiarchaeia archaeon]|nr:hypothetical protein [Candidatus Lokiarchaeia archaeon]